VDEPQDIHEYHVRFKANERIFGRGFDTSVATPCPFCAAADFMVYKILEVKEVISQEHVCKSCHRGSKALLTDSLHGNIHFEFVQTTGPEQPAWLTPKMRRLT
jgi:hypothetical protein